LLRRRVRIAGRQGESGHGSITAEFISAMQARKVSRNVGVRTGIREMVIARDFADRIVKFLFRH
jgi:hypothetical protein